MRLGWKTTVIAATAVALLGAALPGATYASPKRKPKTYTTEGMVYGVGVVTHSTFIVQCPEIPPTQGVDAYIVEVPMEFAVKPASVTVEATSVSYSPEVELSYYTYGCGQGELYAKAPGTMPAGTGYIVVQDLQGGAVDFELTLTQK
jgi:hypothetical protein